MAATTTSIKLDDALKARLQKLGAAQRRSVHWLMREAIAEYVAREEQRAERAHDQTSQGRTGEDRARTEEAHAWLAKLEAEGAAKPLKPPRWRA
jgi:predicted transcriptional regulator